MRRIITAAALTTGILGGIAIMGSVAAQATPIGTVNCGSVPIGSKLVTTCTDTDLGPGTMTYALLCTNLAYYHDLQRIGGNSTQTMVRDCGPGAHPILWNSSGITDYQQSLDND